MHRDCSCFRQPLSQTFGLPSPSTGRLLGAVQAPTQKLSPLAGKVARSAEMGMAQRSRVPCGIPPQSVHYRSQTAPPQAVEPFGCPPTEKSPIGALFIACLFSLILISSRSRCSCRGRTGPRRGHSPRAGSCCRNSRGNSSRSSSRSRGRSPWGRCRSGTW